MTTNRERIRLTPRASEIIREWRVRLEDRHGVELWRASAHKHCTASQAIIWMELVRRHGDTVGDRLWADLVRRGEI